MTAASAALPARRPGATRGRAAASAIDGPRERGRRRVVQLIFVIYLLALLEGSLRKWVLPQFGTYLFFMRDPILLWAYLVASRHALWPANSVLLRVSLAMGAFGVLLFGLQLMTGGHSEHRLLLGAYGWRSYFLYLPMASLIGAVFRREDLLRFFKLTLWLAVPIGVLVAAQFFSPPGAPINVGTADDQALQFHGLTQTGTRTRPMGPFASGAAQQQYVGATFAVLMAFVIAPMKGFRVGLVTLAASAAGLLTCVAMSGSRGTVLQCLLSVIGATAVAFVGRQTGLKGRALLLPALFTGGALICYPLVFPEGYAALTERWTAAHAAESQSFGDSGVFGRALFGMIDFIFLFDVVPALGYGLGFGGNASITLGATVDGFMPGPLAETDYTRHMVDLGPVFGTVYVLFRLVLTGWLCARAVSVTRRWSDPLPLTLFSYIGLVVLSGQITGQGTINLFGWLYAGLLMAACKVAGPDLASASPSVAASTPTSPAVRPRRTTSSLTSRPRAFRPLSSLTPPATP